MLSNPHSSSEIAAHQVRNEVRQDHQPCFNLATFNSTYMEPAAEDLILEGLAKNLVDPRAYPSIMKMERRCVEMISDLFHAPAAFGVGTVGSSEAAMLATLALKARWAEKVKKKKKMSKKTLAGHATTITAAARPNLILSSAAHVCWIKAGLYFDVEIVTVPCSEDRLVLDPRAAVDHVDEGTIGICCILGTTYTGEFDNVKKVNDLLLERGLDVPIHVDAASGGFVAPFTTPETQWDFRLQQVASINVSGHKYGLVYPGIGWLLWRSADYFQKLTFQLSYLGAQQESCTLNFSRSSSHVIAQYYQFIRLGRDGYSQVMQKLMQTARHLTQQLRMLGFVILSKPDAGLPVVAFRLEHAHRLPYDEHMLSAELKRRNWLVPAYAMPGGVERTSMMRVVCRLDLTQLMCDQFIRDLEASLVKLG
ncbi:pyridoxal phosphate-dependent transferase [Microdochium bolleyi]|uniref:Glutamate decarboxylase n=1 Tax=Microdochium bolleyi TaxID=196109 RepID=A0A136ISZ7_9PEZI|nr:pyridoxal phosphate-dependent transferase [Microdochium bolleyi]